MAANYQAWLDRRDRRPDNAGISDAVLSPRMFPHQTALVGWALRRGRAAIFADTGLGKTLMQLEWARVVSNLGRVLILAPLAVAEQTVREGKRFGIDVSYRRKDDASARIVITNYEMLPHFEPSDFVGIVLDESSILKSFSGSTRTAIIEAFADTPYRLACTATPAPNDFTELGNHSQFLGIKSYTEMLAEYFVHDGGSTQDWRLKGHAVNAFWAWVCSWAAVVRTPGDLGYSDDGFDLVPLVEESLEIPVDHRDAWAAGTLFLDHARTLSDQRAMRKATMTRRVEAIATAIAAEPDEPALVWCDFNAEADAITKAIPDSVQVAGADSPEDKASRLLGFADGAIRVLVTKPSIAGFGLNWQHCARVYFLGASHSYEQTYQAIRRCWRFGQTRQVIVRTCMAETERAVADNYHRKLEDAAELGRQMVAHVNRATYASGTGARREWNSYNPSITMEIPKWLK